VSSGLLDNHCGLTLAGRFVGENIMLKWVVRFFVLGVVIATVLAVLFMLDYKSYVSLRVPAAVYLWLWPSSLMLIGVGEAPDATWLSISSNYAIAIAVNGLLYAILGLCVGAIVRRGK
jgi:hypothetical protein